MNSQNKDEPKIIACAKKSKTQNKDEARQSTKKKKIESLRPHLSW